MQKPVHLLFRRKRQQFMMFQSTRLLTAAEIRGDINKKLRELGALTYKSEVHGTDNSQQIKLIVSEISDLKDNLDVVNEHIAVAKDQRRCPGCNAVIPKNSVFCNICGIKIDDTDEDFEL